jgi:uncharacterized membrane protein YecN with MAPEG domain
VTKDQKIVAAGAASGCVAMLAGVGAVYELWSTDPALADVASRLAYAMQAGAFASLPLLIGIAVVSTNRFFSEAIDPTVQKESLATQINGRVVDNTLQQFVLFLVATAALSVNLAAGQMRIIPAATIVFVVARTAFWIGYRINPLYRAFGLAATFYLNICILAVAIWKILY